MLMSASYPLLKFWSKIISQEEDSEFDAEELLNHIHQSLCAIGSSFQSLNIHRRRRFKGCLAKEFSSLANSDSDEGLSTFLFGSNLAEKIKSQTEINSLSRKIVVSLPNPTYKSRAQMSRGKTKVYLRKRSYAGRRGPRQRDRSRSQSQKEIKSSQTQTKVWGIESTTKFHLFREPIFYRFMERDDRGPGNFELSTGMQNNVQLYVNSVKSPSSFQHVKRGGDTCRPRGAESSSKGCYRNLFPRSKLIHFQHFHYPQEGLGEKASGRHVRTESVCRVSSIQDGGYITAGRYPPERGLHDKVGSSRRLLNYSSRSKIKDLFKIFLEGCALSVHMFIIWPLAISKIVHQDTKASACLSKIYGGFVC